MENNKINKLSIVLPAYNEEKNIEATLNEIFTFLEKNINYPFEVIVVNDGSQDKTGEILEKYQKNKNIIVVNHPKNLGYGAALKSGFAQAQGELIFFTDSDRQFDIKELKIFLEKIKDYDFVIGYRKKRKDPFWRRLYASIFRIISGLFFGVWVKDVDCAFKLFKNYVIKDLSLISSGALINLEILSLAKKRGYNKFLELPVTHFPRQYGKQTGGNPKVLFKAILNLFSLWLRIKKND